MTDSKFQMADGGIYSELSQPVQRADAGGEHPDGKHGESGENSGGTGKSQVKTLLLRPFQNAAVAEIDEAFVF